MSDLDKSFKKCNTERCGRHSQTVVWEREIEISKKENLFLMTPI